MHTEKDYQRAQRRPVGDCAGSVTLDATSTSVTGATYKGDGKWCYSNLNLAVGCTESPKTCWDTCSNKVATLKGLEGTAAVVAATCPPPFVKKVDEDKFKCDVGALKAIDWEEVTGQCRCQNSCDCLVEDLYSYDVTKNKGDPGYKNRTTTTHLLTEVGLRKLTPHRASRRRPLTRPRRTRTPLQPLQPLLVCRLTRPCRRR